MERKISSLKKITALMLLSFLMIFTAFAVVDSSDIPVNDLYDTQFNLLNLFHLNTFSIYTDNFPYKVGGTKDIVLKPNLGNSVYRTMTTYHLANEYLGLDKLNPVNQNGAYEASYMRIWIIKNGKVTEGGYWPISLKTKVALDTGYIYRFEFYNYDFCSYRDTHPNYDPQTTREKLNSCQYKAGTLNNAAYQKVKADELLKKQEVKKWLRDNYKPEEITPLMDSYKTELKRLETAAKSCFDTWYIPTNICIDRQYTADKYTDKLNKYIRDTNSGKALTRKSWDKDFENLQAEVKLAQNKNDYYKQKEKIQNKPIYDSKVKNQDYKQNNDFFAGIDKKVNDEFKQTVVDINKTSVAELKKKDYYTQDKTLTFLQKLIYFLEYIALMLGLWFALNKIAFLKPYKLWGYGVMVFITVIYLI